jgi:predicted nucleic acid-binding protein
MGFVLDASIALAWCFIDESTTQTTQLLERLEQETAWVPAIWPLEISNILLSAQRRKRITYADMTQFVELFNHINIEIDLETMNKSFHEILSLAYTEKLTTYDASYLELAIRTGLPLATKDKLLREAGERLGVQLLPTS